MSLNVNSVVPMYRQLEELLRARIVSGEIGDGERLPSEAELGDTYGVSRVTIRQALAVLERDGMLDRAPGKGTFARIPQRPIEGLTRLSGFSEHARAAGMVAGYRVERVGEALPSEEVIHRLGLDESRAFVVERVLLANGSPVGLHTSWLPLWLVERIRPGALTREALGASSLYATIEGAGVDLFRAEERLEPAIAGQEQAAALGVGRDVLVQRVHRTVWDRQERRVLFESDTYLPHAYTYRVELYRMTPGLQRQGH